MLEVYRMRYYITYQRFSSFPEYPDMSETVSKYPHAIPLWKWVASTEYFYIIVLFLIYSDSVIFRIVISHCLRLTCNATIPILQTNTAIGLLATI